MRGPHLSQHPRCYFNTSIFAVYHPVPISVTPIDSYSSEKLMFKIPVDLTLMMARNAG